MLYLLKKKIKIYKLLKIESITKIRGIEGSGSPALLLPNEHLLLYPSVTVSLKNFL